jgi:subtilase family protein
MGLRLILIKSAPVILLCGFTAVAQTAPSSDLSKAVKGDKKGHTTYVFTPPLPTIQEKVTSTQKLGEIQISQPSGKSTAFQIIKPASDSGRPKSSSERFARYALIEGIAPSLNVKLHAHTNYLVLARADGPPGIATATPDGDDPQAIRLRYGLPLLQAQRPAVIAIVDAYHYPTALQDLSTFSRTFGLPILPPCSSQANPCLKIIPMSSTTPVDTDPSVADCGWSGEGAIDLQWAHAIAPKATLIYVEAVSSSFDDLFAAVQRATTEVLANGGGPVSLSWSDTEFQGETSYDPYFKTGVVYFASSGDVGGVVTYPAASPFVISVGGTAVVRDTNHNIITEEGWDNSGGGNSLYELRPPSQSAVGESSTSNRIVPDIAGPAGLDLTDNGSPVYAGTVCSPYAAGWYRVGGTSLATPIVAAYSTQTGKSKISTSDEAKSIYANRAFPAAIRDITSGGPAGANLAVPGYDKVTGVGVPAGLKFDQQ